MVVVVSVASVEEVSDALGDGSTVVMLVEVTIGIEVVLDASAEVEPVTGIVMLLVDEILGSGWTLKVVVGTSVPGITVKLVALPVNVGMLRLTWGDVVEEWMVVPSMMLTELKGKDMTAVVDGDETADAADEMIDTKPLLSV